MRNRETGKTEASGPATRWRAGVRRGFRERLGAGAPTGFLQHLPSPCLILVRPHREDSRKGAARVARKHAALEVWNKRGSSNKTWPKAERDFSYERGGFLNDPSPSYPLSPRLT